MHKDYIWLCIQKLLAGVGEPYEMLGTEAGSAAYKASALLRSFASSSDQINLIIRRSLHTILNHDLGVVLNSGHFWDGTEHLKIQ